jgi:hypothetical protein
LAWFQSLQKDGIKVKGLDNMPVLLPTAIYFWEAFQTLSAKRIITERGPQPIQVSEIKAYAEYMDITEDVLKQDLFYLINRLDDTYLSHVHKAENDARAKQQQKARKAPRRR